MTDNHASINQHYSRPELSARILDALKSAGIDDDTLTLDDLSKFDQLHYRGRDATRTLANLAGLTSGMKVLDIGSGVGGPARTLAAEFGCTVVGIDITEEYVKAAQMLTGIVGLSESVTFREGSAVDLEFEEGSFDAVWTQNAIMNIENKDRVFQEARRVLRRDGILALEALMAGPNDDTHYPIYWASTPALNYLLPPDSLRPMMAEIGFEELFWNDITVEAIAGGRRAQPVPGQSPPPLGTHILYSEMALKAKNTQLGLENGSFLNIYAVYKRVA
jgi:SAM-dependent methyltransferase